MCGIIGIVGKSSVNQSLYDGLTMLQHRGQDAAGIVTCEGNRLHLRKDNGLVRDVFHTRHMINLRGNMGLGMYATPPQAAQQSQKRSHFM
jgi:amidophosphoribosyltransferase